MALTTGKFHQIVIRPSTATQWLSASPVPVMPAAAVAAQAAGSTVIVYCIDAPTGWLVFLGTDQVSGLVDALLSSVSAALSDYDLPSVELGDIKWAKDGAGGLYSFSPSLLRLESYTTLNASGLKTFLP